MMNPLKRELIATSLLALLLLVGCVPQSQYNQEVQLAATYKQLDQSLQAEVNADQAQIKQLQGELKVTLLNEILFPEGGWQLHRQGEQTLNKIVPTLRNLTQTQIVVDGYTDNLPIGPELKARFPSNWELSAARATGVVRYLQSQGVNPNLMSAQGFGDTHPVASNDTPQGRAKNRRIEITLRGPGN
jgi:chemotaxis protein MotB